MSIASAVPIKTISTQEVRQLLDNERRVQIWNVLTDEWFKGENIAGSRRVPLDKVGSEVRGTNLPKNTEIVVYCGGPKCPQSRMAAEKLVKLGYENVRAYEGGLEEWKAAGLSIETAYIRALPFQIVFRDVRSSALKRKRNRRRSR